MSAMPETHFKTGIVRYRLLPFSALILAAAAAAYAQAPTVDPARIYNAASFATGQAVAPGSLIASFGTSLATEAVAQAPSVPLPTTLGNVSVTINGVAAPLAGVFQNATNGDQITAQVPWDALPVLPPGTTTAQIIVRRGSATSQPQNITLTSAAPGIFAVTLSNGAVVGVGTGQAIAYGNTDGQIAAPAGAITGLATHPAKIGDPLTLQILATGLGPVDPPVPNGDIPDFKNGVISRTVTTPTVLVGGVPAQVVFSGLSPYVGVYQLNIVIQPGTPTGDAVPLQIEMNGIRSTNQVTIAVTN